MNKRVVVDCSCGSLNHSLHFWVEDEDFFVQMILDTLHLSFFQRVWGGIRYIFNKPHYHGMVGDFLATDTKTVKEIRDLCERYIKDNEPRIGWEYEVEYIKDEECVYEYYLIKGKGAYFAHDKIVEWRGFMRQWYNVTNDCEVIPRVSEELDLVLMRYLYKDKGKDNEGLDPPIWGLCSACLRNTTVGADRRLCNECKVTKVIKVKEE